MILQPLVENAVKHGISPKIDGGRIDIKVSAKGENVYFEICDSGVGLEGKNADIPLGVGLSNTRRRLKKIYQTDLQLVETKTGGLCVKFQIPISQTQTQTPPPEMERIKH